MPAQVGSDAANPRTGQETMSRVEQHHAGHEVPKVCLQNRYLRLSVMADAGGKIAELRDLRSGRDWLWRNPHIPIRNAVYGADYGRELDSGGWDEVMLSLSPGDFDLGDVNPCRVPDHGDVVGQQWQVVDLDVTATGEAVCEMAVAGRALLYRFRRTLRLADDSARVQIHYSLTNDESFAWPCYWSLHALLDGRPDLTIDLPERQRYRIDHAKKLMEGAESRAHAWPQFPLADGRSFDLSTCFDDSAAIDDFAGKIFVRSPASGTISVGTAGSSQRLALHYDPDALPWLGLWINNGGWSGCNSQPYRNLGLEPATAAFDSVASAVTDGSIPWIQPGQTRRWGIDVELTA